MNDYKKKYLKYKKKYLKLKGGVNHNFLELPEHPFDNPELSSDCHTKYEIDDIEDYTSALEIGAKMRFKRITTINYDYYLNNATNFSQHVFNNHFLITLIGELHCNRVQCNAPNISIEDYIINRVNLNLQKNNDIRVILEYNPNVRPDDMIHIGSEAVRNTYAKLQELRYTNKIIPFDIRGNYLGYEKNEYLYHNRTFDLDGQCIFDNYITPFYTHSRSFSIDPTDFINVSLYDNLINIRTQIEQFFNTITEKLNNRQIVRDDLKQVWQMISDWHIIKELYTANNIVEYIFVGGSSHYKYIKNELITTLISISESLTIDSEEGCINLNNTYIFE